MPVRICLCTFIFLAASFWVSLAPARAQESTLSLWVHLHDKGEFESLKSKPPAGLVTRRSLQRRSKVRPADQLVDYTDLPVSSQYIDTLREHVTRIRQRSKWFNAVSVEATLEQLEKVAALPFVRRITPVLKFQRRGSPEVVAAPKARPRQDPTSTFNYGGSLDQLNQINVPALHDLGYSGQGILIGHFDNGHRLLSHEAFAGMDVVATFDFVDGDVNPAPDPGDPPGWGAHGIVTLSILGGFHEGQLIGPAFGASYLLARTEDDGSETPAEEDHWVAAIEWADSIGVDITSTSLGYKEYTSPFPSWDWTDMDGNTTVITRAGDMAAERGILVVNSVGNAGFSSTQNTMLAPADGDSILAVGAVDVAGDRASFSSVGPTFDGRTKPDVMAMGVSTYAASAAGNDIYFVVGGTSAACPLVAGVAALLMEAVPEATNMQVIDALRVTASQSESPDNLMGWGIVDAMAAHAELSPPTVIDPTPVPRTSRLVHAYPNPFNPGSLLRIDLHRDSFVRLHIYDVRGQLVRSLMAENRPARIHRVPWDGRNDQGVEVVSGSYFVHLQARSASGSISATQKITLVK